MFYKYRLCPRLMSPLQFGVGCTVVASCYRVIVLHVLSVLLYCKGRGCLFCVVAAKPYAGALLIHTKKLCCGSRVDVAVRR